MMHSRSLPDPHPRLEAPGVRWCPAAAPTDNTLDARSERWRYIRYRDGSEELYDSDPVERYNLANEEQHGAVKAHLAGWIPEASAASANTTGRAGRAADEAPQPQGGG